jgi:hypothetical protein
MAGIGEIRRLRVRTIASRGSDDLRELGRHRVSDEVATLAVLRLRRRGVVMLVIAVGFAVGPVLLGSAASLPGVDVVLVFALVATVLLVPSGAISTVRWSRRARAIRSPGWRPGSAVVVRARSYSATLDVRLNDPPGREPIRIRTTLPVNLPFPMLSADRVRIGGDGRRLTVLFLSGRF